MCRTTFTERVNLRQPVFFSDDDYRHYTELLASVAVPGVAVWAWCLVTNHVHLILVPQSG